MGAEKRKVPGRSFRKGDRRTCRAVVRRREGRLGKQHRKAPIARRVALGGGSPRHRLFAQVETRRTARTDRAREIYAPRGLPSYESVRYAGPGIRKVVFQPAPTKQTARRHNPDSPNRSARIPRINRLHESAARPAFPKPRSRGPASDPDFQAPAGSPQRLPRLSQATEPTISGNGVHPEFSGRRFYRPAGPPNSDTCETAPAAPDFSALSPNGSATPPLRITPCNSERYSRMPHRISKKTAAGAVCPY